MRTRYPIAIAIAVSATAAIAEFQAIDTFDHRPFGQIAPQSDWSGSSDAGTVDLDPVQSQNRVLAVRTNSGILRRPLSVADGAGQTLFFRLRFGDQQNYSLGLSPNTSPSEFSDFATEIGMANAPSDLRVWEGDLGNYTDLVNLTPDTWYNVWVYANTADNNFQIWINDSPCGNASAADQIDNSGDTLFGFRSGSGSALRSFYIKTGGGQGGMGAPDGPFYIDDLYLDDSPGSINLSNPTFGQRYSENFESGSLNGWTSTAPVLTPTGGVDDSAYLRGSREGLAAFFFQDRTSPGQLFTGDLAACFGNEIHLSYYGRTFAGLATPIQHNFFKDPIVAGSTIWSKEVGDGADFLTEWKKVDLCIDTNWTDAEAQAKGWARLRGSDSWAETLADVGYSESFKGTGNSGALRISGIDNIVVESSPIPLGGLLAYYPFNSNADDASDNGNHGTVTDAILTDDAACLAESAYDFDGSGDQITIPGFTTAPTTGTVAAWVTVESFDLGSNMLNLIFGQKDNLQLGLGDSSIGADGLWVFRHRSGGGLNNAIGPAPELNRWTHVAGAWDGSDAILYIDGAEVARVASTGLGISSGSGRIGAHPFAPQNYWDGQIDEVVLYERALAPAEIATLAATVSYSEDPPQITSFQMDAGVATVHWQPPLQRAFVDFSTDLTSWTPISEQFNGCTWSGDLPTPAGQRGFLRVRSESASE
jgi:hypothetical protein